MITLQIENIQASKIGTKEGLSESELKAFCKKNQPWVETIFKKKKEDGFHFVALPEAKKNLLAVKTWAGKQKKLGWKHVVVLGIGGSALGTIAVKEALMPGFEAKTELHVLDNIDPTQMMNLLDHVNLAKTIFVVISKSGTTTEPMAQYAIVTERLKKAFPKTYQKHLVFVTDPKEGLLREIAEKEGIHCFDIPSEIGGRFSVLTNVGLVPCALAGLDIAGLLKGAKTMAERLKKEKAEKNPALLLASLQFLMDRKKKKPMTILMPYSNQLFRVGDWYRQLLAESLGKNTKTGPTPINALGTTDQHSQLQLYHDGPNNKWVIFMTVTHPQKDIKIPQLLPKEMGFLGGKKLSEVMLAAQQGTAEALAKNKRPNVTLKVEKVDAHHLGELFMLFEFQVALLGFMYQVNAFDQPGVEASKKLTKEILKK